MLEGPKTARKHKKTIKAAEAGHVRVISRALEILDCFDETNDTLSLMQIVARTRIHKATVFRILCTLVQEDILRQTAIGEYELGFYANRRAACLLRANDLWLDMRPGMLALRRALGETVVLAERRGDVTIDIDMIAAPAVVVQTPPIGRRVLLHESVAGSAILNALPAAELSAYLSRQGSGDGDRARIRQSIAQSRLARGNSSVASPIRSADGTVVGALWIPIPPGRTPAIDVGAYERHLKAACRRDPPPPDARIEATYTE